MSRHDCDVFLKSLLQAELEQVRAEVDSLRASIRYRLGDLMLQGFPLSWRSLKVLPRFFSLYRTYRRNTSTRIFSERLVSQLPAEALVCRTLLLTRDPRCAIETLWATSDAVALASRLDIAPTSELTLRFVTESVARRLGRLKMQGCRIIWWPEGEQAGSVMESYVRALADECRAGESH